MKQTYIHDLSSWVAGFTYSVPVQVRFSDTDMYGHLNNTVPFVYFEYARIEYFKHIGLMNDWLNPDGEKIPVVADLQCDFVKQVFFDEQLSIFVKAESVGKSSVDIHYMAKNENGDLVFTGRGAMVQVGRRSGKGIPWTEEEKSLLGLEMSK
ncbi:acyl-CoA thioesterase [Sporosarcina sp. ACRSM]|uniref:acyl-CoA thioesterase n=1 Tax=Sporosarcina sp. ACRSM TaxID=2918216 RepID=UPI001EF575BD|nr:acyl-CoA thioesterase [Sporosarcina sp. ACRSM]